MGAVSVFYDRKLPRTTSGVTSLMFICNFSDFSRSIEGLWDFLRLCHNCDSFGVLLMLLLLLLQRANVYQTELRFNPCILFSGQERAGV